MNRNQTFVRKVIYVAAIALLLLPLSALSQPATVAPKGRPDLGSPGGKLAQLRARYNLAQAELGEIDPASETMKLSTLGMRGVAVNILWGWANYYKRVEDWDKVELTVNQIIRLQPNFLKVWDFQAHNQSYNISAEFDDYRMRYAWVKKGINFLIEGTHYNRDEPGLLSQVGWYVGQKIGRSDEKQQFRRMFKDDHDFHQLFRDNGVEVDQVAALGPDEKPDNWLVSRLWYNEASESVASGKQIRGMAPVLFYGRVPMSQINAADAMQKDGFFFQRVKSAWEKAADEWTAYGNVELPTVAGFNVRMNDKEPLEEHVRELHSQLDKLCPGLREQVRNEKLPSLTPEQRAAMEKPADQRNPVESYVAESAEAAVRVTPNEILARCPRDVRPQVRRLVDQIVADERIIQEIARNRTIVAFEYWRTRAQAERTDAARQARKDVYDADRLFARAGNFEEARKLYERAWEAWAQLFKQYPELVDNAEAQDLIESIARYRDLLGQLDEPFPAEFPLNSLLDVHYEGQKLRDQIRLLEGTRSETPGTAKPGETRPEETKPSEASPEPAKPAVPKAVEKPAEPAPAAEGKPAGT